MCSLLNVGGVGMGGEAVFSGGRLRPAALTKPATRISPSVVKSVAYPFGQGQFGLSEAHKRARVWRVTRPELLATENLDRSTGLWKDQGCGAGGGRGFLQIQLAMCRKRR